MLNRRFSNPDLEREFRCQFYRSGVKFFAAIGIIASVALSFFSSLTP
jgi:hypothetical protein